MKNSFLKISILSVLFCFTLLPAMAQKQLSVPVDDNVYQLLENAQLRDIIPLLPMNKPYTREFIVNKINEILDSGKLKQDEIEIFVQAKERIYPTQKEPWYMTMSYTNRFDEKPTNFPITVGGRWESNINLNCNDPYLSNQHWLKLYVEGGISEHFSYKFDAQISLICLKETSFAPYTFTRPWDGFQYVFDDFYEYVSIYEGFSAGAKFEPELVYTNWDDKFGIKFSRTRHQWGYGNSSLFLSSTAQPFLGIEAWLYPTKWFHTNFMVGTLEYVSTTDLKRSAWSLQNMFTSVQAQFNISKYVYLGVIGTTVWAKRLELGYMDPTVFPFFYQNQIGDFDNMQVGVYLGVTIPNATHIYAQITMDECNFLTKPFFNLDRNMVANMVGAKTPLPFWTSTLTTQYTKIEPYMYTHPMTATPWYTDAMDTAYVNHGECLGYNLGPNSDEIRVQLQSNPLWFITTNVCYTLVRKGATYGWGRVDGSSLSDKMDYTQNLQNPTPGEIYWKDFLHDGVYEWINSVTLAASLDCKKWNVPIKLNFAYTFSYTSFSKGTIGSNHIDFFEDDTYKNKIGNYFTVSVKVW